jgi:hypothetical protein
MLSTLQLNNTSQPTLSGGVAVPLTAVPPGPSTIVISNTTNVTVFLGTSNAVTTTNGFPIPSGAQPVELHTFLGSTGGTLWVVPASTPGSGNGVGVLISSTH